MINTPHPKLIYFKNIRNNDVLKNDGPYFIDGYFLSIPEEYNTKTQYSLERNEGIRYTTINFSHYGRSWNDVKEEGLYLRHALYNPKYNKYFEIRFYGLQSISRRNKKK